MGFTKFIYNLINWKNKSESLTTPLGATNLNKMDSAIKKINDNLNSAYDEISSEKLDKSTAYTMVKDVTYNSGTGVFTVTKLNGTTLTIDTKLEKIVTNWKYDKDSQKLILTLDDGTTQEVDLSALITQYEFKDSDTIAFTVESDGSVTANVKDGSITDKKIQPNYLADIKTQASNAETSAQNASDYADDASYDAKLARSYAIGRSGGIREGEDADNAKYYMEQAKYYSQGNAENISYDNTNSGAESTNVQDAIDEIREDYMTKENPTGTGAFSMNRKAGTEVGKLSSVLGNECEASGGYSFSAGAQNTSSGGCSFSAGAKNTASGQHSSGFGYNTSASGKKSFTEGGNTEASGECAHAGGKDTVASGDCSNTSGEGTIAAYECQTAIGRYNENKEENIFEVGNGDGDADDSRSNALELTREGDLKVAGGFKGNADSATKLATPRTINGVDFDGSKDITVSDRKYALVGSDAANTAGWYKFASGTFPDGAYDNVNATFYITSTHGDYYSGLFQLQIRSNGANGMACTTAKWLTRIGFPRNSIRVVIDGFNYSVYILRDVPQYGRILLELLSDSADALPNARYLTLETINRTKETTEPVATVASTDGATVLRAIQDGDGNKISTNYAQKRSWYCVTKVGSWSRICSITGTATSELLNVKISQNNQATSYTYMIGTGYNSAYITQISASGFTANSNLQIRLTCDSTNKQLFYVEVLNEYGYNGATSVQAQCGIIDLNRYATSFNVTIYTDYTTTVDTDTVVAELTSQPKGMVADTFYGKLVGNADTATKAEQDGDGNVIPDTYAKKGWTLIADNTDSTSILMAASADTVTYSELLVIWHTSPGVRIFGGIYPLAYSGTMGTSIYFSSTSSAMPNISVSGNTITVSRSGIINGVTIYAR